MVKTVSLLNDFDHPRDACHYVEMLIKKGIPYEHIDENTVIVFDDEADRAKWVELASCFGGFFEKRAMRQKLKSAIDTLPADKMNKLISQLDGML